MSWERGTSRLAAAAGDQQGKGNGKEGEDGAVARRLRVLGSVCASLLVAVLATAAAIGWSASRPGAGDLMESPPVDSFLVAVGGMLLVLLASGVYGRILRRQAAGEVEEVEESAAEAEEPQAWEQAGAGEMGRPKEREQRAAPRKEPEELAEAADGRRAPAAPAAARLRAYSWATGVSFGMLTAAAALGATVASSGKAPFYGLVICIAALFSMVARWPRRSGFDLALRPDRPDAVSRAAAWRHLAQPFVSHDGGAGAGAGAGQAAGAGAGTAEPEAAGSERGDVD